MFKAVFTLSAQVLVPRHRHKIDGVAFRQVSTPSTQEPKYHRILV